MASPARIHKSALRLRARSDAPELGPNAQLSKISGTMQLLCSATRDTQGASMRDIARATGMSLAGMYHYLWGRRTVCYI